MSAGKSIQKENIGLKKCTNRYRKGRKCTWKEKDEDKKYALFEG